MLATFESLRKNIKLKPALKTIDNVVFKLHYRATLLILVVAAVLVSSQQYFGEHIRCISDIQGSVSMKMVETYCFFSATFTVVRHLAGADGATRLHPGVGPLQEEDAVRHHAYYQWVPFVLFFQAVTFYVPHLLWRRLEGGMLFKMAQALHAYALAGGRAVPLKERTVPSEEERAQRIGEVRTAFVERLPFLDGWARRLLMCEILNLLNVVAQIFATDAFLGGRFLPLGVDLLSPRSDADTHPLDEVFPKMTKCVFRKFGPSGSIQEYDALCVMALNIINEKIYAFLWFWLLTLAAISALALLWRLLTLLLHRRSPRFSLFLFKGVCPPPVDPDVVASISANLNFSQWLFLYYLGKNMDGFVFKRLLWVVSEKLDSRLEKSTENSVSEADEDNPKYAMISKDLLA